MKKTIATVLMFLIAIAGAFAHGASEKSGASGKDVDLTFLPERWRRSML